VGDDVVTFDYRDLAQQRLRKAKELLSLQDDDSLIYACLELRKCVEALSYKMLQSYLREVPLVAFGSWQPDKVLRELLRVDPKADVSRTISMQRAETETEPAGEWVTLGEDRRLSAKRAHKMFHQLGSFIHVPTIRHMERSKLPEVGEVRATALQICEELEHVLSAKIWSTGFVAVAITFTCGHCAAPVRRPVSVLTDGGEVECGNCGNLHEVSHDQAADEWYFALKAFDWKCAGCGTPRRIPQNEARGGLDVSCPDCKHRAFLKSTIRWEVGQAAKPA
jgi:DNA-directed RNA polymerase subunit RPC12/RpoP